MSQTKNKTLYSHPFSKAYWKDAAGELKDTRVLVFAALMIALRVAMKLVAIPLAPGLKINTAFIVNAPWLPPSARWQRTFWATCKILRAYISCPSC